MESSAAAADAMMSETLPPIAGLLHGFHTLSPTDRREFLSALVRECNVRELSELEESIIPRLKVDFLERLPMEVALYILTYLEEPTSLVRASAVSRTWHRLATDEYLWGFLCVRYAYHTPSRLRWMIQSLIPHTNEGSTEDVVDPMTQAKRRRRRSFFASAGELPPTTNSASVMLRDYFRLCYMTERNWRKGGRLLSSYVTSELADADPDPNRRLALTCCAMDQDWVVAGMTDSTIYAFHIQSGRLIHTLHGHDSGVWCLMLATGTQRPTGKENRREDTSLVQTHRDKRPSAQLALVSRGGLSVQDAMHVAQQCDPTDMACASTLGWGQPDTRLISAGSDRSLRVWNMSTGVCEQTLKGHTSTIRCVQVVAQEPVAITGSRDGTLRVWDLAQGRVRHVLAGHQHSVRCMAVYGDMVASGSYDFTCRLWNWRTGQCLHVLKGHQLQIYAIAFNGTHVVTGSSDSTVRVWDAQRGTCLAVFQGYTHVVAQLHLQDDILATGSSDGRVIVYSMRTFESLYRVCAHDSGVTTLQLRGAHLVTGGSDGLVKLWDAQTGQFLRTMCEPSEAVWTVRFVEDTCIVLCKRHGKCAIDMISLRPIA